MPRIDTQREYSRKGIIEEDRERQKREREGGGNEGRNGRKERKRQLFVFRVT